LSKLSLEAFSPAHFDRLASWFPDERETIRWGGPLVSFPLDHAQCQAMLDQGIGEFPARRCWISADEIILLRVRHMARRQA